MSKVLAATLLSSVEVACDTSDSEGESDMRGPVATQEKHKQLVDALVARMTANQEEAGPPRLPFHLPVPRNVAAAVLFEFVFDLYNCMSWPVLVIMPGPLCS